VADGDPAKVLELDRVCDIDDIADAIEYAAISADASWYRHHQRRGQET
jgi:hypothetical protein